MENQSVKTILTEWSDEISSFFESLNTVYIALFSVNKELLFANKSMQQLFLTSEVNSVAADIGRKLTTVTGKRRTAFITTPLERGCDDDLGWHYDNKAALKSAGFDIFDYTITGKQPAEINRDLAEVDVIYVEGGSLVHMLNEARASGFDDFVRAFVSGGKPYIGTSTGSFIAAPDTRAGLPLEEYLEDDFDTKGFGLVNFLVMPHWGTDEFKDSYRRVPLEAYTTTTPMVTLTNRQYAWVKGESLQIITI